MRHWYRLLYATLARQRWRGDDRGEINASLAWTGLMVLLAVTVAGVIAAKAGAFADAIDFGSP